MIVDHISVRQIALRRGPDRIFRLEKSDFVAVLDTAPDQGFALARQRLVLGIGDLTGQAESAVRIAMRAGIALHENAMEHRVLGIVDPMLLREILAAHAQMHTAHRNMLQTARGRADLGGRFLAHRTDQHR